MKFLLINGSPKQKSDTMCITNAFLDGVSKSGNNQIDVIDVINKRIKPCLGCFACWKIQKGKCVQQDDQNEILEKFVAADVVIFSFPLYCYGMPSHLKALIDRTIPLAKMSMKEENGVVQHETHYDLSAKHYVVISGCGFPNWSGNFEALKLQCKNMYGENLTMICVPETPMLNEPTAEPLTAPLLNKFREAGKKYGKELQLPIDTISDLETPMLPNDVYIKIVNGRA